MFVPAAIALRLDLPPNERVLLGLLAEWVHPEEIDGKTVYACWPSLARIAGYMGYESERSTYRPLRSLEARGYLTIHPNRGGTGFTRPDRRPNLYAVHLDKMIADLYRLGRMDDGIIAALEKAQIDVQRDAAGPRNGGPVPATGARDSTPVPATGARSCAERARDPARNGRAESRGESVKRESVKKESVTRSPDGDSDALFPASEPDPPPKRSRPGSKDDPYAAPARDLLKEWWDYQDVKPIGDREWHKAVVHLAAALHDHPPERVRQALRGCTVVTPNSLKIALGQQRPGNGANGRPSIKDTSTWDDETVARNLAVAQQLMGGGDRRTAAPQEAHHG